MQMNDNASYFIELTFPSHSLPLVFKLSLLPSAGCTLVQNHKHGRAAALLMHAAMMRRDDACIQPTSGSRHRVSVLTSHSFIAGITICTYLLDSHSRRRGFVHLYAFLPPDAACCVIFMPSALAPPTHITKFLS